MTTPIIAITCDAGVSPKGTPRYECAKAYAAAVAEAGGVPLLLPHVTERVAAYVRLCDGFVLTGGDDPAMEPFGEATHARATVMDAARQAFELALLAAIDDAKPQAACLGVCLGMQLMALHAGGQLHQHLPDVLGDVVAAVHAGNQTHPVQFDDGTIGDVISHHHQAVASPGVLRVFARAPDGVIEAIDHPDRPFHLGVQWHPERGGDPALSSALFRRLVEAAARATT